jgi:hypothetical protein
MNILRLIALGMLIAAGWLSSCKPEEVVENGSLKVQINYVFGSNMLPWQTGVMMKHPKTMDSLQFTSLKFYVSNVQLQKADGSWWKAENSYYLVCAECPGGSQFVVDDIPTGEYTHVAYTLGVDSARCASGEQTGALNPSNGMYWDATKGYIMAKAEGNSPNSPNGKFTLHLGGFGGEHKVQMDKSSDFLGSNLSVTDVAQPVLTVTCNPARFWHAAPSVSVRNEVLAPGEIAHGMAATFFESFLLTKVE